MARAWDVAIVGAGPAGCIVAERLLARGLRVALVEAGPRPRRGEPVGEVDRRLWSFTTVGGSFDWYRVRAVGGRALLWGGWSYRFPEHVLRRGGWPYGANELAPYYEELERRIGVVDGTLDDRHRRAARALGVSVIPKRAALDAKGVAWTPLGSEVARRARTFGAVLRLDHRDGRAVNASYVDLRDERTKALCARAFVLAASPIETTRILLQSRLGAAADAIGRGLVDHLVASYVLIEPAPPPSSQAPGAFPGTALFEMPANTGTRTARPYPGGFSIEVTGPVKLETLGLERLVPGDAVATSRATLIHALGETFPNRRRFVDLDPEKRDVLGRPSPRIHVAFSRKDERLAADMKRACVRLAEDLAIAGSRLIPFVDPLQPGAGHEAGTCAMGDDPRSPCDEYGRLRALGNVWIADASAMPTAGDRHPTLTLLAHAARAADSVAEALGRV